MNFTFGKGFHNFSNNTFINYQMNRLHACGLLDAALLAELGRQRPAPAALPAAFGALATRLEAEGRWLDAAGARRGAEFFTPPDTPARLEAWRAFRVAFDHAFAGLDLQRQELPYAGGVLPLTLLPAQGTRRGRVLFFGGFDSLIEEFVGVWIRLSEAGYDVAAFEGPGQGAARLGGLRFEHDWERPVGAVLDALGWDEVALVGLSMGGYWALRAAGREPRVRQVVAWPPVYDWLARLPPLAQRAVRWMVRARGFMNWGIRLRMRLFPVLDHAVRHAVYLVGGREPMDAVDWLMGMNAAHLGSERVRQDVLLMVGEADAFQPPRLAELQAAALVHARSLSVRRFTRAEHAAEHCQMGNLELACAVLTGWLQTGRVPTPEP